MYKYRNGGVDIGLCNDGYKKTNEQHNIPKPNVVFRAFWLWEL